MVVTLVAEVRYVGVVHVHARRPHLRLGGIFEAQSCDVSPALQALVGAVDALVIRRDGGFRDGNSARPGDDGRPRRGVALDKP